MKALYTLALVFVFTCVVQGQNWVCSVSGNSNITQDCTVPLSAAPTICETLDECVKLYNISVQDRESQEITTTITVQSGDHNATISLDIQHAKHLNIIGNGTVTISGIDTTRPITILNAKASIHFENFTLSGESSSEGGCLSVKNSSFDITFKKVNFNTCKSQGNGGAVSQLANAKGSKLVFSECSFVGCTAAVQEDGLGGAISGQNITVTDGTFSGNSAAKGGALYVVNQWHIESSTFDKNTAEKDGGALWVNTAAYTTSVTDCTFTNNKATNNGGAIYVQKTGTFRVFSSCLIEGNTAVANGGGVYITAGSNPGWEYFFDTKIQHNSAVNGGGVYIDSKKMADIELVECTVFNNSASTAGGGLYIINSPSLYFSNQAKLIDNAVNGKYSLEANVHCGAGSDDSCRPNCGVPQSSSKFSCSDCIPVRDAKNKRTGALSACSISSHSGSVSCYYPYWNFECKSGKSCNLKQIKHKGKPAWQRKCK